MPEEPCANRHLGFRPVRGHDVYLMPALHEPLHRAARHRVYRRNGAAEMGRVEEVVDFPEVGLDLLRPLLGEAPDLCVHLPIPIHDVLAGEVEPILEVEEVEHDLQGVGKGRIEIARDLHRAPSGIMPRGT